MSILIIWQYINVVCNRWRIFLIWANVLTVEANVSANQLTLKRDLCHSFASQDAGRCKYKCMENLITIFLFHATFSMKVRYLILKTVFPFSASVIISKRVSPSYTCIVSFKQVKIWNSYFLIAEERHTVWRLMQFWTRLWQLWKSNAWKQYSFVNDIQTYDL